ncbi:hypothetical protein NLI96_g5300 [Meripilus lineatus]|uniref:Uncharacterized protein n=1 Tax=Meripilus lineatus TaxID=2056292 RepID=A0AAD5V3R7_9APHY|nr:hypothetical protein NLI96_g5300 [Physisporinus lineatus]
MHGELQGRLGLIESCWKRVDHLRELQEHGGESVIQVPVVVTFPVTTEVPTLTLFAPCPSDPPSPPSPPVTPPPPPPTSVPPPPQDQGPSSSSSTPLVPTVVTPIPDVYTSAFSSTLPDGNVVWTSVVITSTHPPTSILVPSRSNTAGGTNTSAASDNQKVGDILGPVLGGALGGFFGLLGKKRDAIFRFSSGMDEDIPYSYSPEPPINAAFDEPEPKPYHYGLVGRASSHPSRGGSPPPPSPHSRSGSTPTIVNANIGRQSPVVMTAMANIAPSAGNRRMSGSSNATMGLSVPVEQAVHLRKRSPTPSQTASFHSHSQSFSQSTRPASRTSMSMNPGALNAAASSSSSTTTPGLRVTPSPTFPVTSSGPPSASSGLVPRSNHPSSSSRLSPSRLSGASSLAPQTTQASPQLPPATQPSQQPSPRPFPTQPPPPYQTPQPSPMQRPPQPQVSTSSQPPPSQPQSQAQGERGIQDPRILQQQQLAALPPGASPPMMRQSWPRYLSNDGVPGSGTGHNLEEDYDEFGRYLLTSGGSGQGAVNAGNGGGREARFASEGRPYGGIPGRVPGPIPIAASVSLGGGAMSVVRGGNGKGVDVRTTSHVSSGVPSTSTSLSSAPPATPGVGSHGLQRRNRYWISRSLQVRSILGP